MSGHTRVQQMKKCTFLERSQESTACLNHRPKAGATLAESLAEAAPSTPWDWPHLPLPVPLHCCTGAFNSDAPDQGMSPVQLDLRQEREFSTKLIL